MTSSNGLNTFVRHRSGITLEKSQYLDFKALNLKFSQIASTIDITNAKSLQQKKYFEKDAAMTSHVKTLN